MRYAVLGVTLGLVSLAFGYLFWGEWGALVGAAFGPLATIVLALAHRPARVATFILVASGAESPRRRRG